MIEPLDTVEFMERFRLWENDYSVPKDKVWLALADPSIFEVNATRLIEEFVFYDLPDTSKKDTR
jgi:hypothetical protein